MINELLFQIFQVIDELSMNTIKNSQMAIFVIRSSIILKLMMVEHTFDASSVLRRYKPFESLAKFLYLSIKSFTFFSSSPCSNKPI